MKVNAQFFHRRNSPGRETFRRTADNLPGSPGECRLAADA